MYIIFIRKLAIFCASLWISAATVRAQGVQTPHTSTLAEERLLKIVDTERRFFRDSILEGTSEILAERRLAQAHALSKAYKTFLIDNPTSVYGYILYGKFLRRIGEDEAALTAFLQANKLDHSIASVKQQIGTYLAERGEYWLALKYFLAAIKLEPAVACYHNQLGELLDCFKTSILEDGLMNLAGWETDMVAAFKQAAQLEPDNLAFNFRYVEALLEVSSPDWSEALRVCNHLESLSLSPFDVGRLHLQMARIYLSTCEFEAARSHLNMVSVPELEESRQKLLQSLYTLNYDA